MISIIIPAYNEEENIPQLFEVFSPVIHQFEEPIELLLVNDGSTDRTQEEIQAGAQKYPFVRFAAHKTNRGLTQALITGFENARGDILVFFPADLQFLSKDLPTLVRPIYDGYDIVVGRKQGDYNKRVVSFIYNWLARRLFKLEVHDLNSIKAFRRQVVEEITLHSEWHRYIIPLAVQNGFSITEVPVTLRPRKFGKSKFRGIGRILIGFLDLFTVKFQLSFSHKPMLLFGTLGLGLFGFGIFSGLIYAYDHLIGAVPLKLSLTAVSFFLIAGILIVFAGFLGEMLVDLKLTIEKLCKTRCQLDRRASADDSSAETTAESEL